MRFKVREKDLQKALIEWLRHHGCKADRVNTTGVYDPTTKRFHRSPNITKGMSDIIFCTPTGRYGAIEVKSTGGRPTKEQKEFLEEVNRSGGIGIWTDNIHEATTVLLHELAKELRYASTIDLRSPQGKCEVYTPEGGEG